MRIDRDVSCFRFTASRQGLSLLPLLALLITTASQAAGAGYSIVERWQVGGTEKWDYLAIDAAHDILYVSRAVRVDVVDMKSGKVVSKIPDTAGVHGIAIAGDLNRGFTSNGKSDSVTAFDLDKRQTLAQIKLSGSNPDSIVYEPSTKRVYAFNGKSNSASVIDAVALKEVATIALPGRPEFAVARGGRIYVNIEDKNSLAVIDVASGKVVSTWPLEGCNEPTGLAVDDQHQRVFSVCHNSTAIVSDMLSGRQTAKLPIGSHVDAAAYDPVLNRVLSSNGDSADVTVIEQQSADRYRVLGSVKTAKGAKTMALDPARHRLFVPAFDASGALEILVVAPDK